MPDDFDNDDDDDKDNDNGKERNQKANTKTIKKLLSAHLGVLYRMWELFLMKKYVTVIAAAPDPLNIDPLI